MALTSDIMHGRIPSSEMHPQLQPKKTKVSHKYCSKRHLMRCTLLTRWRMALAIDIMYGHGASNKMHSQSQPKKTKVHKTVLAIYIAPKGVICDAV